MIAVLAYLVSIVAANLLVATFGPWIVPLNAFVLIGLDLVLRDKLHDTWHHRHLWPKMMALILTGSALTWLFSAGAGRVALASAVAFALAGAIDAITYHALRHRPQLVRANGSNLPAALTDSIAFPTLAFGEVLPVTIGLQFGAKVLGGALWSLVLFRKESPHGQHHL
jgi:uncharacterized PurR-regulated membrane protein YhhQ (DUF165 family)